MQTRGPSVSKRVAAWRQRPGSCLARRWRGSLKAMFALSCTVLVSGCDSDSGQKQASVSCAPFDTQDCWGPGACKGGQMCQADGTGWTQCDCGSTSTGASDAGPASRCAVDSESSTKTCADDAAIRSANGKYWINNNVWGRPADDGTSQQCSWLNCLWGDTLAWGTSWNWTGVANSAKAYPSVVLGWHWGLKVPDTGLPVQISDNRAVNTGWNFTVARSDAGSLALDVSYDLWLHTIPQPDSSGTDANAPTDEVMIWLYGQGPLSPVGDRVAGAISLADTTWDLWEGAPSGYSWTTHTFLRTTNTNSSTLNISDFLNYLVASRGLDSSKYLTSVESGTEVFVGSGEVDTTSYYCTVQ
jgi:xyloglucan-specific endo-beta-1,4-glucanase